MVEFEKMLFDCEVVFNTTTIKYESVCVKSGTSCFMTESALTFIEDLKGATEDEAAAAEQMLLQKLDDKDLVNMINSGQGGVYRGNGNIIEVKVIFGDT
jgi:hypothetical protein